MSRYTVVRRIMDNGITYEWVVLNVDTGEAYRTLTGNYRDAQAMASRLRKGEEA
jgi:hypothetical protein